MPQHKSLQQIALWLCLSLVHSHFGQKNAIIFQ